MKYLLIITILMCSYSHAEHSGEKIGYSLSIKEQAILDAVIQDDMEAFSEGMQSFVGSGLLLVSVDEITKTYEENQVSGDQKYFDKKMNVTGTISKINSGIGNVPYLSMAGPRMFSSAVARFERPDIDRIAKLKKGQKISLVCIGGGVVLSSPALNGCVFADDYARAKEPLLREELAKFLAGEKPDNKGVPVIAGVSISLAKMLPDSSPCFSRERARKECMKDVTKVGGNEKKFNKQAAEVAEIMAAHGLKVKAKSDGAIAR